MSKYVKNLISDHLRQQLDGVNEALLVNVIGLDANANNRQHSPNEHLRLDHLFQGIRTTARLLRDLAALPGP